jgi:hypothetical protein
LAAADENERASVAGEINATRAVHPHIFGNLDGAVPHIQRGLDEFFAVI